MKKINNQTKQTSEKGFWKSLGLADYLELIIWIIIIISGVISLIEYFG